MPVAVRAQYSNWLIRLNMVATLVLFGVTFKFLEVQHAPMFVTYGLALCSQWIISLTLNNRY